MVIEGGGENVEVGSASFGLGVDLQQLARDLDRAEQLARTRAQRIQDLLGQVRLGNIGEEGAAGVVRTRRRRQIVDDPAPPPPPPPPIINQVQVIRISRRFELSPANANDLQRILGPNAETISRAQGGLPQLSLPNAQRLALAAPRGAIPLGPRSDLQRQGSTTFDPSLFPRAFANVDALQQRQSLGQLIAQTMRELIPSVPSGVNAETAQRQQSGLPQLALPPGGRLPDLSPSSTLFENVNTQARVVAGLPQLALAAPSSVPAAATTARPPRRPGAASLQEAANDALRQAMAQDASPSQSSFDRLSKEIAKFLGVAPNISPAEFGILPAAVSGGGAGGGARGGRAGGRQGGVPPGTLQGPEFIKQLLQSAGASDQLAQQYAKIASTAANAAQAQAAFTRALQAGGVPTRDATRIARQLAAEQTGGRVPGQGPQVGGTGGFSLVRALGLGSPQGVLRAALGGLGIGAGLNVAATLSRDINKLFEDVLRSTSELANRTRELGAAYGAIDARKIRDTFGVLGSDRSVRGSTEDFADSAVALQKLNTQYGLSDQQISGLIRSAGQLARIQGGEVLPNAQALGAAFEGNVQGLQNLGLHLLDANGRLRSVGLTYEELVDRVGRARAQEILFADIQQSVAAQQQRAAASSNATADALDRINVQANNARNSLVQLAAKPFEVTVKFIADTADAVSRPGFGSGIGDALSALIPGAGGLRRIPQAIDTVRDLNRRFPGVIPNAINTATNLVPGGAQARTALEAAATDRLIRSTTILVATESQADRGQRGFAVAVSDTATAAERAAIALQKMGVSVGAVVNSESVRNAAALASDLQQAAQGLEGAFGAAGRSDTTVATIAALRTQQVQLQQNRAADIAKQLPGGIATDPLQTIIAQGETDQARAAIVQRQAQGQLTLLDTGAEDRRLSVQNELNDLTKQQLDLQNQAVAPLLREAEIRDQITINSRENLQLTQQRIQAEQAALPAQRGVEDLDFRSKQAELRATTAIVQQMRGETPQFDVNEQINTIISTTLDKLGGAELGAFDATRGVTVANRATQDDALRRQAAGIPLEDARRGQEDFILANQRQQREAQAQIDAVGRALQSATLGEGPQRTQLEQQLNDARKQEAQAAVNIANAQGQQVGLPPVTIQVNVDGTGLDGQALGNSIAESVKAAAPAVIEALIAARNSSPRRAPADVAGAR